MFSLAASLGATSFFTSFSGCTSSGAADLATGAGVSLLIGAAGATGVLGFSITGTLFTGGLNSNGGKLGAFCRVVGTSRAGI